MLAAALICWMTWSGTATVLAGVLLLVLARPGPGFDPGLTLTIAGSERGLRGGTSASLASLQRGRRAQVCLDASGDAISRPAKATIVLAAGRGGVVIERAAGLEMSERTGRPWRSVEPDDRALRSGVRYRIDGLYLRLD